VVEQLLRAGAQSEAANKKGGTALVTASSEGHVEVVRLLLAAGADVNAAYNNGHTSLIAAASHGHEGVVRLLLNAGADTAATNKKGMDAAALATEGGHDAIARLLQQAATAETAKAIEDAFSQLGPLNLWDEMRRVEEIMGEEAAKEPEVPLDAKGGCTRGSLGCVVDAAIRGDKKTVERLLEAGVDKNIGCSCVHHSMTPLQAACGNGHGDVVRLLLAAGADVNAANKDEMDAAALASEKGHPAIARLLQQAAGAESSEATRAPSDSPSPSSPSSPSSDPGPDEASALTWSRAKMNIEETVCGSIRARSAVYPEMKAFISEVAAKFAAAPGGAPAFLSGQCLENFLALPDARTPQDGLKPIIVGPLVRAMRERKALDEAEAAAAASGEAPSPDPSSRADGTPLVHGDLHKGLRKVYDGNEEGWIPMRIPRHTCATCGKLGNFKKCARCQGPRYCSKECQVDNWKDHKQECEPRSAPPA